MNFQDVDSSLYLWAGAQLCGHRLKMVAPATFLETVLQWSRMDPQYLRGMARNLGDDKHHISFDLFTDLLLSSGMCFCKLRALRRKKVGNQWMIGYTKTVTKEQPGGRDA